MLDERKKIPLIQRRIRSQALDSGGAAVETPVSRSPVLREVMAR